MSSRSLKMINMIREVQNNEKNLQIVNARSIKNAERDLFLQEGNLQTMNAKRDPFSKSARSESQIQCGIQTSTSEQSQSLEKSLDILHEIQEDNLQPVNVEKDLFSKNVQPTTSLHSHLLEKDITHEIQKENLHTMVKRKRSNLVEYDYSTDEDFSADSNDDHTFQLTPSMDSSDITDFSDYEIEIKEKKITRKRKSYRSNWKVNVTKARRSQCLPYTNKRKECQAKVPKSVDCSNCKFKCTNNFTEDDRTNICTTYWGFNNYARQKDYLLKFLQIDIPKRRRVDENSNKARSVSKTYRLQNKNGIYRVCAKFFQATLCISNGPINSAVKNMSSVGCFSGEDKRGKKIPGNKTSEADIALVKAHIEKFPVMESHYVRKSSKKLYLESNLSISKMYSSYKEELHGMDDNHKPVSEKTYRRIFCENYNYSFFKPKKDLCATCSRYEQATGNEKKNLEFEYSLHLIRKQQCNESKDTDKKRCANEASFAMCSFDLQSVLQLPYSSVSLFYYSRKICVYNLTIYVGQGETAHCFTWNELHGKRGSNEIGSILYHFLKSLPPNVSEISLFCDTCGGQNRNQQVAAILLHAVQTFSTLKKIELKFLESGHSHMECDSMHSAIEAAKKYKSAFTMKDWVDIFQSARSPKDHKHRTNGAYKVHLLKFTDFYDLHDLASATIKNRNKDENGDLVSWLKIKCIKFQKEYPDIMFYRYDHSSDYKKINVAGKGRKKTDSVELKPAYKTMIPISEAKKADIVKLADAGHIPEEVVSWYKNLPSTKKSTQTERLPEPNFDEEYPENE